jgi:catechol 2,3-dioxygenase-like lactoylglutathione lyase family enzyme
MLIGLHHVGRVVHDLEHTARQLGALSGWPISSSSAGDDPLVAGRDVQASARAEGPNGWIELVGVDAPVGRRREVNEPGVTHAGIQTGGIEQVMQRALAAGIESHADPVGLGTGFQYAYVRDVEQLVTEIEGAPHAPVDLEPWLVHGAIATPDADRLRTAYEDLIGVPALNTARLGGHPAVDRLSALSDVDITGTWVPLANAKVEIWQFHSPPTTAGEWPDYETPGSGHLAFESDDLHADLNRATAAGFTVEDDPADTGWLEIARLRDPDGNWIELIAFARADDELSLRMRPDLYRPSRMDALLHGDQP